MTKARVVTAEEELIIKEMLRYDSETGHLIWKVRCGSRAQQGAIAGALTWARVGEYYIQVRLRGKQYFAHRLAWFLTYGEWPTAELDHKNGDGTDNRLCNLRLSTPVDNSKNRGMNCRNSSGASGVVVFGNGWMSYIAGKYLGYFDSFEDAVAARKAAEDRLGYTEAQAERSA